MQKDFLEYCPLPMSRVSIEPEHGDVEGVVQLRATARNLPLTTHKIPIAQGFLNHKQNA